MKTRTWLIILGLCAIIFSWLGYQSHNSVAPQDVSQTAGWKTYTNDLIGFSLKYPADHTPYIEVDQQNNKLTPATSQDGSLTIADNEAKVFCCEPATLSFNTISNPQDTMTGAKDVVFNGRNAKEIDGTGALGSPYKIIRIPVGQFDLTIIENQKSALLDQVLSTVTFTK